MAIIRIVLILRSFHFQYTVPYNNRTCDHTLTPPPIMTITMIQANNAMKTSQQTESHLQCQDHHQVIQNETYDLMLKCKVWNI